MDKLTLEKGAHDLVCTSESIFYRINTMSGSKPYRYFKSDLITNTEISVEEFNRAKYRAHISPYEDGEEVIFLPNGNTIRCFYQSSIVRMFDYSGQLLRELPYSIARFPIYSITIDRDGHLWTAEPSFHRIGQYDIENGQMLFELGGNPDYEPGELNYPEDIKVYDDFAFISDMANNRIVILNTATKDFETYCTFDQPVYLYIRFNDYELVMLADGIYKL